MKYSTIINLTPWINELTPKKYNELEKYLGTILEEIYNEGYQDGTMDS